MTELTSPSQTAARRSGPIAAAGLLAAGLVIVAGNVNVRSGDNGGLVPAIVTAVVCLGLAIGLFAGVVRRRPGPAAVLILGILSLLSLVVFWSGVPLVLGSATFAATAQTVDRGGRVRAGQALAAVACVAALVANLLGAYLL